MTVYAVYVHMQTFCVIIELVDSLSRDDPDVIYITKTTITRKPYTLMTSNLHQRVLRVILQLVGLFRCQRNFVYMPNPEASKTALSPPSSSS